MTAFDFRRHAARETAIGLVVNVVVAIVPSLLSTDVAAAGALRPVREVAVGLTPPFFMASLMSALVPSLLLCRNQARGRWSPSPAMPRLRPARAVVIAAGLAVAFTILVLALIHAVVAPLAPDGIGAGAILALRIGQAALAATTITPLALMLLLRHRLFPARGMTRMVGSVDATHTGAFRRRWGRCRSLPS